MVKMMYNDQLVYKVAISVFWGYFMKTEGRFKFRNMSFISDGARNSSTCNSSKMDVLLY